MKENIKKSIHLQYLAEVEHNTYFLQLIRQPFPPLAAGTGNSPYLGILPSRPMNKEERETQKITDQITTGFKSLSLSFRHKTAVREATQMKVNRRSIQQLMQITQGRVCNLTNDDASV